MSSSSIRDFSSRDSSSSDSVRESGPTRNRGLIGYLARHADAVSNANRIVTNDSMSQEEKVWINNQRNAIGHAHVSAELAHDRSPAFAEFWGNVKEIAQPGDPKDSIRDQYNNEVGRRIGRYVKQHNLPREAIDDLIIDALRTGHLVVDFLNDPRVANESEPLWSGPSDQWRGLSLGRQYGHPDWGPDRSSSDLFGSGPHASAPMNPRYMNTMAAAGAQNPQQRAHGVRYYPAAALAAWPRNGNGWQTPSMPVYPAGYSGQFNNGRRPAIPDPFLQGVPPGQRSRVGGQRRGLLAGIANGTGGHPLG